MNLERKQRMEKRKRLQQLVDQEKSRNASPSPTATDSSDEALASLVIYSNHFVIETQADENGDDCFAVYRVSDLLSVMIHDGATPEPVHVFDLLLDASNFVAIADKIVARSEPGCVGVAETVAATPTEISEGKPQ
jgi:hypothetical protein